MDKCSKCKHLMLVQVDPDMPACQYKCRAIGPEVDKITGVESWPDCETIRDEDDGDSCWFYERDGGFLGWLWDLILDLPWIFK